MEDEPSFDAIVRDCNWMLRENNERISMLNQNHTDREILFHNELADTLQIEDESLFFTAPTAMEARYILSLIGNLEGKRILDLGSGTGEAALNFARMGGGSVSATSLRNWLSL